MRYFLTIFCVIAVLLLTFCTPAKKAENTEPATQKSEEITYQHPQTRKLVDFVDKAAKLIEEKGEEAYPFFRQEGSEWFTGDEYIFVWGMDGMRYVYPPDVSGEGKSMLDLQDVNGKPIGKMIIAEADKGSGWVFYQWPRPEQTDPVWKATYIVSATLPNGEKVLAGSGIYDPKPEKAFVYKAVNDAVTLLQRDGLKAMDMMRTESSKFIFMDSYIFIKNMQGLELLNPIFPQYEGKNIFDLTDADGQKHVKAEIEAMKTQDEMWKEYLWPKPGSDVSVKKITFLRKTIVEGDTLLVAAGFYPEED